MPLIQGKSKKSFGKNVSREMKAGKPQDQALAIAYNVKRKNMRKMAKGGMVDLSAEDEKRPMPDSQYADSAMDSRNSGKKPIMKGDWDDDTYSDQASESFSKAPGEVEDHNFQNEGRASEDNSRDRTEMDMETIKHPDEDGEFGSSDEEKAAYMADGGMVYDGHMDEEPPHSLAEAIMRHRRAKAMADGGMVDLEANSREDKNNEDDLSYNALLKEQYDDSQISAQPEDSNEHGHDLSDEDEHDMVPMIRRKMKMKRMG